MKKGNTKADFGNRTPSVGGAEMRLVARVPQPTDDAVAIRSNEESDAYPDTEQAGVTLFQIQGERKLFQYAPDSAPMRLVYRAALTGGRSVAIYANCAINVAAARGVAASCPSSDPEIDAAMYEGFARVEARAKASDMSRQTDIAESLRTAIWRAK